MFREQDDELVFPQGIAPVVLRYTQDALHTDDENKGIEFTARMDELFPTQQLPAGNMDKLFVIIADQIAHHLSSLYL
jgi:hypothetical protein